MKTSWHVLIFVYALSLVAIHIVLRLHILPAIYSLRHEHAFASQYVIKNNVPRSSGNGTQRNVNTPAISHQMAAPRGVGKASGQTHLIGPAEFGNLSKLTNQQPTRDLVIGSRGCRNGAYLLVVVCSAVEHFRHRDVIRRTWASGDDHVVEVFFIVGFSRRNRTTNELLRSEYVTNGDLLLVNTADGYESLTSKSVAMLGWSLANCRGVRYLLKVDDDAFVNRPRLLVELRHMTHERFVMGDIIAGARPERNRTSKWYTPRSVYKPSRYPDYVSGSAYVISGDLILDLYRAARFERQFWLEDVFVTGMCRSKVNGSLIHNSRFKSFVRSPRDTCVMSRLTVVHRVYPEQVIQLWHRQRNNATGCQ